MDKIDGQIAGIDGTHIYHRVYCSLDYSYMVFLVFEVLYLLCLCNCCS